MADTGSSDPKTTTEDIPKKEEHDVDYADPEEEKKESVRNNITL